MAKFISWRCCPDCKKPVGIESYPFNYSKDYAADLSRALDIAMEKHKQQCEGEDDGDKRKAMDRVLTDILIIGEVRRKEIWLDYRDRWAGRLDSWGTFNLSCVALLEEQAALTKADILKAVGEWLEQFMFAPHAVIPDQMKAGLQKLLRGEMPEA